MILGWAPGLLGLLAGLLSGGLLGVKMVREEPWDVHDERSYAEPDRITFRSVAPSLIFLGSLATMCLGLAAIDRDVNILWGYAGDALGLVELVATSIYLLPDLK